MSKHCDVTGRPVDACDCGACDDLDDPQDGSDEGDGVA